MASLKEIDFRLNYPRPSLKRLSVRPVGLKMDSPSLTSLLFPPLCSLYLNYRLKGSLEDLLSGRNGIYGAPKCTHQTTRLGHAG